MRDFKENGRGAEGEIRIFTKHVSRAEESKGMYNVRLYTTYPKRKNLILGFKNWEKYVNTHRKINKSKILCVYFLYMAEKTV